MKMNLYNFLLGNRKLAWLPVSFSIAAAWIWAVALLVSAQVTAQYGLSGLLWFSLPNAGALMVFGFLASIVRRKYPDGFTLPEYIRKYHGRRLHVVYVLAMLMIQVCAVGVQLIGAGHILEMLFGVPYRLIVAVLTLVFLLFSIARGFLPVAWMGVVQIFLLVSVLGWLIPSTWRASNLDYAKVVFWHSGAWLGFGLQGALALLAGPPADQQHWQRAFAIPDPRHVRRAFILAGLIFLIVPVMQGSLGLIAHAYGISGQMAGPTVVLRFVPSGLPVLALMFVVTLVASGSNALCASSCIGGVDVGKSLGAARVTMVITALLGLGIAWYDVPIVRLWLFYGSVRTAIVSVTLAAAIVPGKISSNLLLVAIVSGLMLGIPVYLLYSPLFGVITLLCVPAVVLTCGSLFRAFRR